MAKRRGLSTGLDGLRTLMAAGWCLLAGALAALPGPSTLVSNDTLTRQVLDFFRGADLGSEARLTVSLVDVKTGISYVSIDADRAMTPASLIKVATTAAALDALGPEHRFTTRVEALGDVVDGVLYGDLVIRGGGDMTLGPRFGRNRNNVTEVLDNWAAEVRKAGITRITGHVIGDDSRYQHDPQAIGWEPMEFGEWYSAEVSALCYNDNCIDLSWRADSKTGALAKVRKIPDTDYVTLVSGVRSGPKRMDRAWLRYFRFKESNEIRARGLIPAGSDRYDFAAVHDPAAYTAFLLTEQLRRQKVAVDGTSGSIRSLPLDEATTRSLTLVEHRSPELARILPVINSVSQNLYAEVLLREVAMAAGKTPSFLGGAEAVRDWMLANGLHRAGFTMVDGSGLSPVDRIAARQVTDVLRHMRRGPHGALWKESLAEPGSGSLRSRFAEKEFEPLRGNLRAKTGYISKVITMGGYFESTHGTEYAFAVMINDFNGRRTVRARDTLDGIVLQLQQAVVLP